MQDPVLIVHGPAAAEVPLVLDSPHSGTAMPADFGAVRTEAELREGEDSFIDELYRPAAARGVPLLAALFPRTYLDPNRHAGDIDPELLAEPWPEPLRPSAKARIGKALVWRTLDADKPIYDRRLTVAEMQARIERCHRPYHETLRGLLDSAHARFGAVWHVNCHSMGPETSVLIEGVDGRPRADIVLGDRDGTSCAPEFTAFVRDVLAGFGYDVARQRPVQGRGARARLVRPGCRPPQPAARGQQASVHGRQDAAAARRLRRAAGPPDGARRRHPGAVRRRRVGSAPSTRNTVI